MDKARDIEGESMVTGFWGVFVAFFSISYFLGAGFVSIGISTGQELFYYVAASSGSLAGIITAYFSGGFEGLMRLFSQFKNWKSPYWLYLFAVFSPWVFVLIGLAIYRLGNPAPAVDYSLWVMLPTAFVITTIQAGLGEELGWRGFMTPKLNERYSLVTSATIVGVGWAIWHLPLFFIPDFGWNVVAAEFGFFRIYIPYAISLVLMSILYSWLYRRGGRNILLPILLHGSINTAALAYDYMNTDIYNDLTVLFVPAILFSIVSLILMRYSPAMQMIDQE